MSVYTTELRYIIEQASGFDNTLSIPDKIKKAAPLIFNFDFPIWDEAYRPTLEYKILLHYYVREISADTPSLWQLWLQSKMLDIMPKYVEMYNSIYPYADKLYFNKSVDSTGTTTSNTSKEGSANTVGSNTFKDINTSTTTRTDDLQDKNTYDKRWVGTDTKHWNHDSFNETTYGKTTTTSDTTDTGYNKSGNNTDIGSNLPQTKLNNLDYATDSNQNNYSETGSEDKTRNIKETLGGKDVVDLNESGEDSTTHSHNYDGSVTDEHTGTQTNDTNGSIDRTGSNTCKTDTTGSSDTNTSSKTNVSGVDGKAYSELISQWIPNIQNIDLMIINDLEILFMQLW